MLVAEGHRMGKTKSRSVAAKRRSHRRQRGRPKHDIAMREPNGRASRARPTSPRQPEEDVKAIVFRQRAKTVGWDNVTNQQAESALGVLCILGRLSDAGNTEEERKAANRDAYDAGVWWRGVVHGLHRLIGAPPPYPRSPAWEMVSHGPVGGDFVAEDLSEIADPEARAIAEDALRKRKQRLLGDYEGGRKAMGENALAVEALVIHDRAEQLDKARAGLAALVAMREG